jgi:hypothetical protein
MADGVILAKKAFQIAVCHENCTRAMKANEGPFFSEMGGVGGNLRHGSGAAVTLFSFKAVHAAVLRTKGTILKYSESVLNFFRKQTLSKSLEISWFKIPL